MRRIHFLALLALFPAVAQSQQSLTSLEIAGRFGELARTAEARAASGSVSNTSALAPLCVAYSKLKRYAKLFPCLEELGRHVASGDVVIETDQAFVSNSDATALVATLRAQALLELGDYHRAAAEARAALSQVQDRMSAGLWPPTKYRLLNLGVIPVAHAMLGEKEIAKAQLLELRNFSYPFIGNAAWRPMKAYAIARTHIALNDFASALPYVAQDDWFPWINDPTWGLKGDDSADTHLQLPKLLMRGICMLETGDLSGAKLAFDLLLRHPRIEDFGELYWIALYQSGRLMERQGMQAQSVRQYGRAIDVIELQRSAINTEASKIGFAGDKQAVYAALIRLLLTEGGISTAFEYIERSKARALVDMLAEKQDFAVSAGNAEQVKALLAIAADAEASSLIQDASADKPQIRSLAIRTRQQLREQAPELASLVSVSPLSTLEVQALLPQDEALVEYYYHAPDFLAFVLTRSGIHAVRLDARNLVEDLRAFRKQVENPDSPVPLESARRFYDRLIAPVADLTDKKKLIFVAHGPLHYLPFNALHDGNQFVVEKFSLRFLPSASVLKYLRAQAVTKPGGILAFGNPDLGDPRFDLPYAQEEAVAVTRAQPQSRVLLRKEASESAFRQYGEGFRYLHFATHGEFNPEAPLKSALLLSRDAATDGLLTVDKLYSLRLDADLVTLSACETGLGKVAHGDDVVGLARGFLYAGSRSIVASLWKVDDLATSVLMTGFYDNLKQGDKREALRQAQLDTLKKYPHPYFWAAFQITGSAN